MQKLRLILSFDHELSLGGVDSYRHNLFEPTEQLFEIADELAVPLVLFTDILSALRYKEWDYDGFFLPYCRQLESALGRGHDVQLHIHPHWMDSTWRNHTFQPSKSFSLSAFKNSPPPNDIPGIIKRSCNSLIDICRNFDPNYSCVAYRAGGFNLDPELEVLASLYENGIRIDSSIIKGYRFKSDISSVDYSRVPTSANWVIGPGILEVPVASKPRTPLNNIPFLIKRVVHRKRGHDARGRPIHATNTSTLQKLSRLLPRSAWTLGFDDAAQSLGDIMQILRSHVAAHGSEREIICSAISHPKNMGTYEFNLMRAFVKRTRREFGDALTFTTFTQLHRSRT